MINSFIKNLIKFLILRPYYRFRNLWPVWDFYNRKARKLYTSGFVSLNGVQQGIVNDLKKYGIAVTHIDKLFPGDNLLPALQDYASKLLPLAKVSEKKGFFIDLWNPAYFELACTNPFVELSLRERVVAIANAYLEMFSRFYGIRAMKTTVMGVEEGPTQSQLWHRDPDDKKLCKMFLYLNDVDEGTGPFCYVAGSHPEGKFANVFPQLLPYSPGSGRVADTNVRSAIPRENMRSCTGGAGTIIFADTTGLHKGGYSKKRSRLMFLATFMSPTPFTRPRRRRKFQFSKDFGNSIGSLPLVAQHALRRPLVEIP